MMQFSGIDAVFYYSTTIFYQAEVNDPELATTLLGIINVLVTIVAVKYMDSAGRKKLLIISWIGLLASYSVLTMSFVLKPYYGYMDVVSSVRKALFSFLCTCWFTRIYCTYIYYASGIGRSNNRSNHFLCFWSRLYCLVHHCRNLPSLCTWYGNGSVSWKLWTLCDWTHIRTENDLMLIQTSHIHFSIEAYSLTGQQTGKLLLFILAISICSITSLTHALHTYNAGSLPFHYHIYSSLHNRIHS